MKIGIIGAMEQEVSLLRNRLIHSTIWQQAGCEIYSGQLHGMDLSLLKSGIGKAFAAFGTTLLLDHFKPEIIINIGSAGSLEPSLKIGDVVVSHEVRYHDVDLTAFGYEQGQMAQCPASFIAAPSLITLAEEIIKQLGIYAVRGLLVSGDIFINSTQTLANIRHIFPKAIAVEMEATAIAHVCHQFSVPFVAIRTISDVANQTAYLNFKKCLPVVAYNSSLLVSAMVQSLADQR